MRYMTASGSAPLHRDNNFDALRVLAAAMVLLFHSWALTRRTDEPIAEITHGSLAGGPLGVWMFFAISGYLVSQSYVQRKNLLAFVEARVLRIYPAFVACIVFGILVGAIATTLPLGEYFRHPQTWGYLLDNLRFELKYDLPGVFAGNPYPNAVNGSIWTLPAESMMYVLVALMGVTTLLLRPPLAMLALATLLLILSLNPDLVTRIPYMDTVMYAPAVRCFLLGILAYALRDRIPWHGGIALALPVLTVLTGQRAPGTLLMCVAITYITFWLAFHPRWKLPVPERVGDTSYGLYVYAFPIQQLIVWRFPAIGPWVLFVTSLAGTFALAWCSWRYLERPALGLKGRASGWLAPHLGGAAAANDPSS